MCGVVGFSGKNSKKLERMMASINHRGPDDNGQYESEALSLGHLRLSILDLSSHGHQPMDYEDFIMVYNGEVYNYKEIRDELITYNYTFDSNTDSEVILKAYHKWGIKSVDKFRGMFAIVIYNKQTSELTLIRDRVGVKPLYYYFDGEEFVFGSELRPIMEYFKEDKNLIINKEALYEYFKFGYISSNLSIFENCNRVPAGNYLTFNTKTNSLKIEEYWSILPFFKLPKFQKSEEELVDELEAILIEAFKYRMVSDVPVGVFLSGGVDSSIVAAILQKHYGNIHTFTIGFNEAKYNEAQYAKEVANYIGTKHIEKYLSADEAKVILDRFVDIYDEPFGDSSGIPTTLVSQIAKASGVKVVLSADGGDEIFCGYSRYWTIENIGSKLFKIPKILRKSLNLILDLIGDKNIDKVIKNSNLAFKIKLVHKIVKNNTWQEVYCSLTSFEVDNLLSYQKKVSQKSFDIGLKENPMQGMMLWDYHRYMVDDILTKVDRATMNLSIEGREPLLDHKIAEFMAQVPFELKYKNGDSKYLLKKVLERYIPREMIERPKQGFGIPIFEWFNSELKDLFKKNLNKEELNRHCLLNTEHVIEEYNRLSSKNVNTLWFVLVFQMWYKKYINNHTIG